jgi:fucose 4-O-acetylase-like acetyltransferase
MPLFFIISGMVFRPGNWNDTAIKSLSIIIIADLVHCIGCFTNYLLGNTPTITSLIKPLVTEASFSILPMWFLISLSLVHITHQSFYNGNIKTKLTVILIISALFVFSEKTNHNIYQISTILPGFLFYTFGYWLTRTTRKKMHSRSLLIRITTIIMIFLFTSILATLNRGCTLNPAEYCNNWSGKFIVLMVSGKIGFIPIFIINALLGSIAVLFVADTIALKQNFLSRTLSLIGNATLDLLIVNGFVITFIQPELLFLNKANSSLINICFAISITVIQITLIPAWRIATRKLIYFSRQISAWIISKISLQIDYLHKNHHPP